MGEPSKILNPEKRILMPDLNATCSLDVGCPADLFSQFCDEHPDHTVVVYANTSAAVKARADWMVTSGIALPIVSHLKEKGEKIMWAPDRHLGKYIEKVTGADMLLWPGSCVVHEEFKSVALERIRRLHPDAAVLVHPEQIPGGKPAVLGAGLGGGLGVVVVFFQGGLDRLGVDQIVQGLDVGRDRWRHPTGRQFFGKMGGNMQWMMPGGMNPGTQEEDDEPEEPGYEVSPPR